MIREGVAMYFVTDVSWGLVVGMHGIQSGSFRVKPIDYAWLYRSQFISNMDELAHIKVFGRVNGRGIRNSVRHEYSLHLRTDGQEAEIGEGHLIGPELVQENTEKISQIKDRLKAARDRPKKLYSSYDKLNFVEEPVEIMEREFKKLKRSRISIVKVRWNSKSGPEFMWEREDQMKLKYPHLFSADSS
ncbi:hypothetical protein Tco_0745165 [Tanacetum coccineum]